MNFSNRPEAVNCPMDSRDGNWPNHAVDTPPSIAGSRP